MAALLVVSCMVAPPVVEAQVVKLTTPDTAPQGSEVTGDRFGSAATLDGDLLLVGVPLYDGDGSLPGGNFGVVYAFRREGDGWIQEDKFISNNVASGHHFGGSVELADSNAVVVSTFGGAGTGTSAAYIFERTEGPDGPVWTETERLLPQDPGDDGFLVGTVSFDGTTVALGSYSPGGFPAGAAYIFRRTVSGWSEEAKIVRDAGTYTGFGGNVVVSGDLLLVGAAYEDDAGLTDAGAVYAYRRTEVGGEVTWVQESRLLAAEPEAGGTFGSALVLTGDSGAGAAAVVGAPGLPSQTAGDYVGDAYVLRRAPGPKGEWTQEARLRGADTDLKDLFGRGVDFVGAPAGAAGDLALIAAPAADGGDSINGPGAAYVFERVGDGVWTERAKLQALDSDGFEGFGTSIALQAGPGWPEAVVGAPGDDEEGLSAGAVYIFDLTHIVPVEPEITSAETSSLTVYPNPSSGAATVVLTSSESAKVTVTVFDVLGREVAVLHDERLAAGMHQFAFDGAGLPASVYLVRVERGSDRLTERITLLR